MQGAGGTPFSAIGANAFRTTNCRSRSAMRGDEFHGNTRRDGQPAYPVYMSGFLWSQVDRCYNEGWVYEKGIHLAILIGGF